MTQEEKQLALRIFEKMMEDKECLSRNAIYAIHAVDAAKIIYTAIAERDNKDLHEEEARFEAEQAEEAKRKEERSEQSKQRYKKYRDNAKFYLMFEMNKSYKCYAHVKSTSRSIEDFLTQKYRYGSPSNYLYIGLFSITEEEGKALLKSYKLRPNVGADKELICNSIGSFSSLLHQCPSAEDVDLSGFDTGSATILKLGELNIIEKTLDIV